MKRSGLIGLVLALGVLLGSAISPLLAQAPTADPAQTSCYVGEGSGAACAGKWVFFAGNSHSLDLISRKQQKRETT